MGPLRRMEIYVRFQSPPILKYLEPLTGNLFMTQFTDCIFNDDYFTVLGGDNKFINDGREIDWDDKSIISSYPCTNETELQVHKILDLQQIASNLSDMFTDYKCVTKFWNHVVNMPC
jgi:hypothetical protein